MSNNSKEEPKTAPMPHCWYDLVLGPSFKDDSSNKFCTLRYEFKPASIDKNRSGTLHKNKDQRVSVEFQNNQPGKPKVTFEGSSEDYKENDAVLFFDGETFRLERLHRAVKQLRHLRMAGESASSVSMDPRLSPVVGRGGAKPSNLDRSLHPPMPVEVERIEIGPKSNGKEIASAEEPVGPEEAGNVSANVSPGSEKNEDGDEHMEIDLVDIFGALTPENDKAGDGNDEMNVEEEIADMDDDTSGYLQTGKPTNTLKPSQTLTSNTNAEEQRKGRSSSSSSSSESSSESESSSSSGRSRSSNGEEVDEDDEVNSI
ncbi:PREDICTED: ELL-associated factor 1 [Tarenaya hassleriana]|uniref:ELL-associated factor 1 n=1 Tax=Tarenaya hassleriana TaxID=28532 RepID=UPI00053C467A|nr:PREDICTED: ELL-associated factor 1 [Tarenaya hassleriana]